MSKSTTYWSPFYSIDFIAVCVLPETLNTGDMNQINDNANTKMRIIDLYSVKRTFPRVDKCNKCSRYFQPSHSCPHSLIDDKKFCQTGNALIRLDKNLPSISDIFARKMSDTRLELSTGVSLKLTEMEINVVRENSRYNDDAASISTSFGQIAQGLI